MSGLEEAGPAASSGGAAAAARAYTRSSTTAMPWPTPMHIVHSA
jgi:hypothetical protein